MGAPSSVHSPNNAPAALRVAALSSVIVFGPAARGGCGQNRLVLVGFGVATASAALVGLLIILTDPFNATKALTWLSGSTYGRTWPDVVPLSIVLVVGLVVAVARRTELDLVSLDEETPRLLGLSLGSSRFGFLLLGVLLSATPVAAAGTIGFVGSSHRTRPARSWAGSTTGWSRSRCSSAPSSSARRTWWAAP